MAARQPHSFDVRIWQVEPRKLKQGVSYRLRWSVADKRHSASFVTRALADSHRAELMTALRQGEAFDIEAGQPLSKLRKAEDSTSWWEWALAFTDLKWPQLAPTSRRTMAQELATLTLALCQNGKSRPADIALKTAMVRWAFNAPARASGPPPATQLATVKWLQSHTRPLRDLEDPLVCRQVLDSVACRLDGRLAAATSIARRRAVFHNVLGFAVERGVLVVNPLDQLRWRAPKSNERLDPRVVATPAQARALLDAVK